MATVKYLGNLLHDPDGSKGPLLMLGKFQAGATQAISKGQILELTGDTNAAWVPLDSDFDMSAAAGSGGKVCVSYVDIRSGDRAGYYPVIVPRPGDIFEADLAAAGATEVGTALYYSSATAVTVSAGSNIIGHAVGQDNYPKKQGHLSVDGSPDAGTTVRSQSRVKFCFQETNSYYSAFQRQ